MAYTYHRKKSPFIWFRFKDQTGAWQSKASEYRKDNPGDRRQAKLVAEKMGMAERERHPPASSGEHWDSWVESWLRDRYGVKPGTFTVYSRYWRHLRKWLQSEKLFAPSMLNYRSVLLYKTARQSKKVGINTIVHELKFLGVVMTEAIRRFDLKMANPCLKLGFQRTRQEGKTPWTDAQIATVARAITGEPDWMQATFVLGYFQAARMRQCEVPLDDIHLEKKRITYWRSLSGRALTKGDKPFSQPIATGALPLLSAIVARRVAAGEKSLCEVPLLCSVEWRRFLDRFGFSKLSHHGLRTTWITRAALSGKISRPEAMAFVNHASPAIHEIYQRLNTDDVARVADALNLPDLPELEQTPLPPASREDTLSNAPSNSSVKKGTRKRTR